MRILPALLITAGMIVSLSACTQGPFASGCDSPVSSGDASSVVTASGKFGTKPTIDFPTPVVTDETQRSTLIAGDGATLNAGDVAIIEYTLLDGASGQVIGSTKYAGEGGGTVATLVDSSIPSVTIGLQCASVGSRVAIATTAAGAGQEDKGTSDSYVFVVDVLDSFPGKARGIAQVPQSGMPSVVTAPNGAPGITILDEDPPTELTVNVLQASDGEKVKEGDFVIVKYTAVLWSDSSVFDSTWTGGQADIIKLTASDTVVEGLVKGLVGQRVGSQVLIVIPPDLGYGDDGRTGVPAGSTLVYVVDLLGVAG